MLKIVLAGGALCAGLSVVLGAFAAHGLKARLSEQMLGVFQTGVQYQFYHALALLLVGIMMKVMPASLLNYVAGAFFLGILLFSGSLYALALTGQKWFGPITPLGGVCFIVGWLLLAFAVFKAEI
jgi:uncharacterized membrane protein YgdD (TMEM256/DUF423 family)